jgi:hypothetical protein
VTSENNIVAQIEAIEADIKAYEQQIVPLREAIALKKVILKELILAYHKIKVGDRVTSRGKVYLVVGSATPHWYYNSKPWLEGSVITKSGQPSKRVVTVYGDWEKIEEAKEAR